MYWTGHNTSLCPVSNLSISQLKLIPNKTQTGTYIKHITWMTIIQQLSRNTHYTWYVYAWWLWDHVNYPLNVPNRNCLKYHYFCLIIIVISADTMDRGNWQVIKVNIILNFIDIKDRSDKIYVWFSDQGTHNVHTYNTKHTLQTEGQVKRENCRGHKVNKNLRNKQPIMETTTMSLWQPTFYGNLSRTSIEI